MTISTTTIKNSFAGNNSTSAFTYTFKIAAASDMKLSSDHQLVLKQ